MLTLIEHGPLVPHGDGRLTTNDINPKIVAITRQNGGWSTVSTVVDLDEAVWTTELTQALTLRYMRDSLFEQLLAVQEGRPATDGQYETTLQITPEGAVIASEHLRIGDYTIPEGAP